MKLLVWEDAIIINLKETELEVMGWIHSARNRTKGETFVNAVLYKATNVFAN
jgi:hypothetical protein